MNTTIRRVVTAKNLEVRTSTTGVTVEGHASTFNQSYDMGWYNETVAPGAFTRTLKTNPDVRLLVNHDGLPLARTRSGTLELSEDRSGLYMRSTLDPADPDVKRLVPKMARGDLDQMSFSFGLSDDGDEWSDDHSKRTLRHLNLEGGDVSIVTYPANPNATVALRSRMLQTPDKLRDAYRSISTDKRTNASRKAGMRALLENLILEDDSALTDLAKLVNGTTTSARHRTRSRSTDTAIDAEHQTARIALAMMKHR